MRALCWNGVNKLETMKVPDPQIKHPRDAIVRVRLSSVCGSDLHFINGFLPTMKEGDILGHEFVGEIVEVGRDLSLKKGTRVVVPSIISCGDCWYCKQGQFALCERGNPNSALQEPIMGYPTAGFYGCSHMFGGFGGSHAEYIRVPFADVACFEIPDSLSDEKALFLSDAAPTAYLGAEMASIKPGDTVAVWGCGAVGLLAQKFAFMMGAERVIAIDGVESRLKMARETIGSETFDFNKEDIFASVKEATGGLGPDCCIDAVGMEAQGSGLSGIYDKVKQSLHLATDRGEALRQAMKTVRMGGNLSILGIYFVMDKFPVGLMVTKNLKVQGGLQNGHFHIPKLLKMAQEGQLDASFLATHKFGLDKGATAYEMFKNKEDGCIRAVFEP